MDLYSFDITGPNGDIEDFGCYPNKQCCIDTGNESMQRRRMFEGSGRIQFISHNTDGSAGPFEP